MQSIVANLTPALVCQDHTTSPSARNITRQLTCRVHRIPHPTLVTIAKRPSCGLGTAPDATDLGQPAMASACDRLARRANRACCVCVCCPSGSAPDAARRAATKQIQKSSAQHAACCAADPGPERVGPGSAAHREERCAASG